MDSRLPGELPPFTDCSPAADDLGPGHAVLNQVQLTWDGGGRLQAVVLHAASGMLILESLDRRPSLPPVGTELRITGDGDDSHAPQLGRLAELGRGGRFLVALGDRPVRRALRLRVSLPGTLRTSASSEPQLVEIVDMTTGGARVRGVELPVGTQISLGFTPPGRSEPVTVRAAVAHSSHRSAKLWIGVTFRLVALRGGR